MKRSLLLLGWILALLLTVGLTASAWAQNNSKSMTDSLKNISTTKTKLPMTVLSTYLFFDGNCRQAMEFYQSCFGGELTQTSVGQSPMKNMFPSSMHDKTLNARLVSAHLDITASDWLRPAQTPARGNMVCLYLSGGTPQQLKALFDKLSQGADITDPLKPEAFGMYGALNDKFGVRWMFHTDQKD